VVRGICTLGCLCRFDSGGVLARRSARLALSVVILSAVLGFCCSGLQYT